MILRQIASAAPYRGVLSAGTAFAPGRSHQISAPKIASPIAINCVPHIARQIPILARLLPWL